MISSEVKGSGPAGRIIESDLQQFIENNQFKQANDNNNNDNNILQDATPIETVQEKVMEKGLEERILLKGIRKKSLNIW